MSDLPDSRHDLGSVQASRWTDQPEVIRLARLGVSARATDAEDCERLLSMLGLDFTAEEVAAFKRDAIKDTVIYAVGETGELR